MALHKYKVVKELKLDDVLELEDEQAQPLVAESYLVLVQEEAKEDNEKAAS